MPFQVYLYGIQWDDGKGEYDVSDLPENLCVTIRDHDGLYEVTHDEAIAQALQDATDEYGSLIEGTKQIVVK